ncbi:MAG: hypothetical protein HC883_03485 [Bdellovibrionaceae bacterium]|nr:hypothetical protein [Pseudobdellovibrionaceae bacterium]
MDYRAKLLLLVCGFSVSFSSFAKETASWQHSMQELSNALKDVFPFLYSHSEFRKPENRPFLLKNFDRLTSVAHGLPGPEGKALIGSGPLFNEIKNSVRSDLAKAKEHLTANKYESAQTYGQSAVQKCFACHTAIQMGPQYPSANQEIMGVATPFPRGKIVVFGAIRQFRGALDFIEKEIHKVKDRTQKMEWAKLHLVVSLRALQDFDSAQKFIQGLKESNKDSKDLNAVLERWQSDINNWKSVPAKVQDTSTGNAELNFVANLQESLNLHNQKDQVSAEERARIFYKLGKIYRSLGLTEFSALPGIYFTSCTKENASPATKELCKKALLEN